jgi:hypothetical protein
MATINHRSGDTFGYAGTVSLPTGRAWSAACALRDVKRPQTVASPDVWVRTDLTLVGPNATDSSLDDYLLVLSADADETETWATPASPGKSATLTGAIKFWDDSIPAVEITADQFVVYLTYQLTPHA